MKKIIISGLLLSIYMSAHAQYADIITDTQLKKPATGIQNRQTYPFLHQWTDIHTQKLLSKIEKYASENEYIAPLTPNVPNTIQGWHARQTLYYASTCLEKALYNNSTDPSSPYSEGYMKRLHSIARFMNLKDEKFATLDVKTLNNYCSEVITSQWELGACQVAKDPTVKSSPLIMNNFVPFAINILKNDVKLPDKAPVDCSINSNTYQPIFLTYNANIQYQITKPFTATNLNTFLGSSTLNAGEAIITAPEALDKNKKPVVWKALIVQHQ